MQNKVPNFGISGSIRDMATKITLPKDDTTAFTLRLPKGLLDKIDKKRKAVKSVKVSRQQLIQMILEKVIDDLVIEPPKD